MSNRASSSPAERGARGWHREPWPWLLMAGPLAVVVASIATAWIAMRSDDGVVSSDYYKLGLLINQRLDRAAPAASPPLRATIRVAADGNVRVAIEGPASVPERLRMIVGFPGTQGPDEIVQLERQPDGAYAGRLAGRATGRRVVTLESAQWRLPTTIVAEPDAEIRVGTGPG